MSNKQQINNQLEEGLLAEERRIANELKANDLSQDKRSSLYRAKDFIEKHRKSKR